MQPHCKSLQPLYTFWLRTCFRGFSSSQEQGDQTAALGWSRRRTINSLLKKSVNNATKSSTRPVEKDKGTLRAGRKHAPYDMTPYRAQEQDGCVQFKPLLVLSYDRVQKPLSGCTVVPNSTEKSLDHLLLLLCMGSVKRNLSALPHDLALGTNLPRGFTQYNYIYHLPVHLKFRHFAYTLCM
jgi:hypothetical protein